jgi:GTP cyclohydrolase I
MQVNEENNKKKIEGLASHYREVITLLGEDVEREGLVKTPQRVAKAMLRLTNGYDKDPAQILKSAMFEEDYQKMVMVKDIELFSLCEHHILPFYGKAHVAYIPDGKITGLSKIARVVEVFSRRLQVQERLTHQICQCIQETLQPKGVMVMIEAKHMCMQMRGVEKVGSETVTTDYTGIYNDAELRDVFMKTVKG